MAEVTPADAAAMNNMLAWAPDSSALYLSSNNDREFTAVARYDLADGVMSWLVTADDADLTGWLSPDGKVVLVERNEGGASVLALHDASSGTKLANLPLPAKGSVTDHRPNPRWAPDSATVVLSVTGSEFPGDVLLAELASSRIRPLTSSAQRLRGVRPAVPEMHHVPAPDGESVPCLVYRSPDADSDDERACRLRRRRRARRS